MSEVADERCGVPSCRFCGHWQEWFWSTPGFWSAGDPTTDLPVAPVWTPHKDSAPTRRAS